MARMLFLRDIDVDVHLRCRACGHGGVLPRAMLERRFGPNYPVLSIAPHYRCSRCDSRDVESRPAPVESLRAERPAAVAEEPSFDASLAALQGLLASVRGPAAEDSERAESERAAPEKMAPGGWDDDDADGIDDTLPAFRPFADAGSPPPKPAARPLEDLVADGPADEDAAPLWEPVSLADLAARSGGGAHPDGRDDVAEPGDAEADDRSFEDTPFDETLNAMRRLFAEAELAETEEDGPAEPPEDEPEEEPEEPAVFSHKALVRRDFEDDPPEFDEEPFGDDEAAEFSHRPDEDEPTEEEILAFAIRDPEKAPPPRVERAVKAPAPPAEEDEGLDKTLAALRSMIEDAATEPKILPVRRKTKPVPDLPADASEVEASAPDEPPVVRKPAKAKPSVRNAGGKRSAQEREIEEAMRALGGDAEDEEPPPPVKLPSAKATKPRLEPVRDEEPGAADAKEASAKEASDNPPPAEAEKDASPLSKTIAALRGMLELDGRRKR